MSNFALQFVSTSLLTSTVQLPTTSTFGVRASVHHSNSSHLSFSSRTNHQNHLLNDGAHALNNCLSQSVNNNLKIAVIGFGTFGQFLAKAFISQGHIVYAHSRYNYHSIAHSFGATFFDDPIDICESHPDVILLCTSISSTETVLKSLPIHLLARNTLFVDVLSVKELPRNIFLRYLPTHFDILCTHPMFGPMSGKHGWHNLKFMFDKVRIGGEDWRTARVERFLDIFRQEGCTLFEMTCAEHDKEAARSQFMTHTIGRLLEKMELKPTNIDTKGYLALLKLVDNTTSDSVDLYHGLFTYNQNAMVELERLDAAFEVLKKELFEHMSNKDISF